MLSSPQVARAADRSLQDWPWSPRARLHNLADVQESDIGFDREEYAARLGVVLQLARKARGLSQVQAGAQLGGVTPVSFTRWESGTTGLSAYDLARLVHLYGLDVDADLVLKPPASKIEIKRRLSAVAQSAQRATRRAILRPLPPEGGAELE